MSDADKTWKYLTTPQYDVTPHGANLRKTFTDPEGRIHTWNPRSKMYEVSGFGTPQQRATYAAEQDRIRREQEQQAAAGRATQGKIGMAETEFQRTLRGLAGARQQADLNYASGARGARRSATGQQKQAAGLLAEGGGGVTRSPAMQTYREDILRNRALQTAGLAAQRAGTIQGLDQATIDATVKKEQDILNILIDAAASGDAQAQAVLERKLAAIQQQAGLIGG